MIFLERISEFFQNLLPGRKAHNSPNGHYNEVDADSTANPWTKDLERLAHYQCPESSDPEKSDSGETKIQLLMEHARLEKAKEALKEQQEQLRLGDPAKPLGEKAKRRNDATLVDTKAWWGQAVATWDPDDAKNLGPQGEIRHPRTHKWFN